MTLCEWEGGAGGELKTLVLMLVNLCVFVCACVCVCVCVCEREKCNDHPLLMMWSSST